MTYERGSRVKELLRGGRVRICSVAGCETPAIARGWCNLHYRRWRRNGDPERLRVRFESIQGRTVEERFWEKVNKRGPTPPHRPELGPCWLWIASTNAHGYGQLKKDNHSLWLAHRLSYELHYGPPKAGLGVLHKCDVPACVNPEHLFLGTPLDNTTDMLRKGRFTPTPRKLSSEQEAELCELRTRGWLIRELADKYGITPRTVRKTIQRTGMTNA